MGCFPCCSRQKDMNETKDEVNATTPSNSGKKTRTPLRASLRASICCSRQKDTIGDEEVPHDETKDQVNTATPSNSGKKTRTPLRASLRVGICCSRQKDVNEEEKEVPGDETKDQVNAAIPSNSGKKTRTPLRASLRAGICCSRQKDANGDEKEVPRDETNDQVNTATPSKSGKKTRTPLRVSLRASIKQLLQRKSMFSFANNSFKSDGSKLGNGNIRAKMFTYKQLSDATNNFTGNNLLGEGGFGKVYKACIDNKKQVVAVKQLDRNGAQGNREFLVEVLMLSLLNNDNLVDLVGYCAEGPQRLLVYEFMPNGSLEDHLLDLKPEKKPLDWKTRMKIAKGAAKGLEYLHETANPPVVYRDFKASNILLNEEFNPKLSDFGLAKLGPMGEQTHVSTRVMGTFGYCAPEYAATGHLTIKSDVYSFGVVFLEIITGRRVYDPRRPSKEQNLVEWAKPMFREKDMFHLMVDPLLKGDFPQKSLYQALGIAAMCLQEDASLRPFIGDVVTALEFLCSDNP